MANAVQFEVDDTSPSISYFPFGDTFSDPDLSAGWNPYFSLSGFSTSPGETGNGTSLHITSHDGASLIVEWRGTGIQLYGNITQATYDISIDGALAEPNATDLSNNILATYDGLANAEHSLLFVTHMATNTNASFTVFDKAFITSPPPTNTSANLTFVEQLFNDNEIAFHGKWSFEAASGPSNASHKSMVAGDSAQAQFTGTSFFIRGTTSPSAGKYSVTLDNVTTNYSAESSFTQDDSLLFFASGLDPLVSHQFEIVNVDGSTLALSVGGLSVDSVNNSTTSPVSATSTLPTATSTGASTPVSGTSIPQGTIAALVLAGILIFIILGILLLFFLVVRPRRNRFRESQRERGNKEREAGLGPVLDIGPAAFGDSIGGQGSAGNGFRRWKAEVEDGLGSLRFGALGLVFRHSDSIHEREEDLEDAPKTPSTSSSKRARKMGKGKGKMDSPSSRFPSLRSSRSRSGSRSNGEQPQIRPSTSSGPSSLSYFDSPQLTQYSFNAPVQTAPPAPESGTNYLQLPVPPPGYVPPRVLVQDDRGSVYDYADDAMSMLGAAEAQMALRSLSPRTSERKREVFLDAPPAYPTTVAHDWPEERERHRERQRVVDLAPRSDSGRFLDVRESSPFKVDFRRGGNGSTNGSGSGSGSGNGNGGVLSARRVSRVRFKSGTHAEGSKPDKGKERAVEGPELNKSTFRLTPLNTSTLQISDSGSAAVTSFLDFASSSDASVRTGSNETSSSRRTGNSSRLQPLTSRWSGTSSSMVIPPPEPPQTQSRWSATTVPSSTNQEKERTDSVQPSSSSGAHSSQSSSFPFPVSLPASPHHPAGFTQPRTAPPLPDQLAVHSHPADLTAGLASTASPTESVPMSVSDIHFRHSDSEEQGDGDSTQISDASHLPRHPPLPGIAQEVTRHDPEPTVTPLSTPTYIVQRVLGMPGYTHSASSLGHARSGSAMLPSPLTPTQRTSPGGHQ